MEVQNKFRFPEILRYYMLNISRESCFDINRSIIAPPYFTYFNGNLSSHPSKRPWLAYHHDGDEEEGFSFVIPFAGRGKGYIMWSKYGEERWEILYDCLARGPCDVPPWPIAYPNPIPTSTFEHHYHIIPACDWPAFEHEPLNILSDSPWSICRWVLMLGQFTGSSSGQVSELVNEIKRTNLPDDLRTFKCTSRVAAVTLLVQVMLSRCVETLGVPARKIQRQFRLWRWRMRTIFDPHTVLGQYNLRIKANASIRV